MADIYDSALTDIRMTERARKVADGTASQSDRLVHLTWLNLGPDWYRKAFFLLVRGRAICSRGP